MGLMTYFHIFDNEIYQEIKPIIENVYLNNKLSKSDIPILKKYESKFEELKLSWEEADNEFIEKIRNIIFSLESHYEVEMTPEEFLLEDSFYLYFCINYKDSQYNNGESIRNEALFFLSDYEKFFYLDSGLNEIIDEMNLEKLYAGWDSEKLEAFKDIMDLKELEPTWNSAYRIFNDEQLIQFKDRLVETAKQLKAGSDTHRDHYHLISLFEKAIASQNLTMLFTESI